MQAQSKYSTKPLKKGLAKGNNFLGEGEVRYQNVCFNCDQTKHLIRLRRAGGLDIYLCKRHALGVI